MFFEEAKDSGLESREFVALADHSMQDEGGLVTEGIRGRDYPTQVLKARCDDGEVGLPSQKRRRVWVSDHVDILVHFV